MHIPRVRNIDHKSYNNIKMTGIFITALYDSSGCKETELVFNETLVKQEHCQLWHVRVSVDGGIS